MRYQKFIFLLLLVQMPLAMLGQKDSIFIIYPSDDYSTSTIRSVKLFKNETIGLIHYGNQSALIVVDLAGNILKRKSLIEIDGYSIHSCFEWIERDTDYVAIVNVSNRDTYYVATIGMSKGLDKFYWIDTTRIPYSGHFANIRRTRFNEQTRQIESFGVVTSVNNFDFISQIYFSLNSDFTFDNVRFFNAFRPSSGFSDFVMDFHWIEPSERYFVSLFSGIVLLMNTDSSVILKWPPRFTYQEPGGTWSVGGGNIPDCVTDGGNVLTCLTRSIFNGPSDISIVRYTVEPDTIRALQAFPLNTPSLEMNIWPHLRRDHEGNYVLAGTNGLFPLSVKHKLKIAKFSSAYQKMWETQFDPGSKNFEVWDMAIDDNNDIILVGRVWDIFDPRQHGFLLKVYSNGRVTASTTRPGEDTGRRHVVVTPNPASSSLCLQVKEEWPHGLRLWSADGRLVFSEQASVATSCFDLPAALPAGVYAAEVVFADGYRVVQKVIVVR